MEARIDNKINRIQTEIVGIKNEIDTIKNKINNIDSKIEIIFDYIKNNIRINNNSCGQNSENLRDDNKGSETNKDTQNLNDNSEKNK